MAWRKQYSNYDWNYSSDENGYKPKAYTRAKELPASSADEAIWRAAKRLGSALRWPKMDLTLLADVEAHDGLLSSLEDAVGKFSDILLLDLGIVPVSSAQANRPEVLELVNLVISCNARRKTSRQKSQIDGSIRSAGGATRKVKGSTHAKDKTEVKSKCVQTSGG